MTESFFKTFELKDKKKIKRILKKMNEPIDYEKIIKEVNKNDSNH